MINDRDTNVVYFSDLLSSDLKYKDAFERIKTILEQHKINYRLLNGTKDIWARDYMPLQVSQDKLVQFRYEPSYLSEKLNLQSSPQDVLPANGINAEYSSINLDGGNVVKWNDRVVLTERIVRENSGRNKSSLINELQNIFQAEVLLIPDIKSDMTGHADGHVRFIDEKTILVNQLDGELKYWQTGFINMINKSGLNYVEMPWFPYTDKKYPDNAIGIYVNYLEISDLILFPIFEVEGNKDREALEVMKKIFPDRTVEPVNINEIGLEGGLMNCITWSIME